MALCGDRVLGKAKIYVNGELLRNMKDAKLILAGDELTEVEGDNESGFTSEFKAGELTVQIMVKPGDGLRRWVGMCGATVTVEGDTGHTYVLTNARQTKRPNITFGKGGEVELMFTSDRIEEVLNA